MRHDVIVRVPKQNGRGYELITVEVDGVTGDECAAAAFAAVPRAIAVLTVTPSAPRVISARVLDDEARPGLPTPVKPPEPPAPALPSKAKVA